MLQASPDKATAHPPSSWQSRLASAGLALVGCGIATYLALFQYGVVEHVWEPLFGRGTIRVLRSDILQPVSHALGIPVHDAALGAASYLFEAALALAGGRFRRTTHPYWMLAYAALVVLMGLTSLALILIQGLVLHAWCTLCLVSASLSLMIFVVSWDDLAASLGMLMHGEIPNIGWPAGHNRRTR